MTADTMPGPAVHDATWFARRARNALRRPLLIAIGGGLAFVLTLIVLLIIPRRTDNSARRIAALLAGRGDTTALVNSQESARSGLASAEEALAQARRRTLSAAVPPAADTLPVELIARRDSLRRSVAALSAMIERVENAPLPASYRALGEMRELGGEPRVQSLLDSLAAVEREREEFGAVGGVDPIFVALTARATAIGRSIQGVAEARVNAAQAELVQLRPPPPRAPVVVAVVDTSSIVVRRDAAVALLDSSARRLVEVRQINADIDRRVEAARAAANVEIPPLTLLAAALVLAAVLGFAAALLAEMRRARIADPQEAEEVTGLRALAVVLPKALQPERTRRRADRDVSPLIDATSDAYRLLYLHAANFIPKVSIMTVSGDDTAISATVGANLAAAASYDARSTLLVDAELSACAVSSVLGVRAEPGFGDVIAGRVDWTEAVIAATIGRERALDVMPSGVGGSPADGFDPAPTRQSLARIARRYDLVVLVMSPGDIERGDGSILPAPDVIYCARIGETGIAELRAVTAALRGAGARLRGLVLWNADVPLLQSRELAAARASVARQCSPFSRAAGSLGSAFPDSHDIRMWSDTLLALERAHLLRLLAWSALSIMVGTALFTVLVARRNPSALLRHFAIQTVAWGVLNLAIAGIGVMRLAERDLAAATRLDRMLWMSLGLDAGVMMAGLTLAVAGWMLSRRLGAVGAGIGVLVQGAALLTLDLRFVAFTARVL